MKFAVIRTGGKQYLVSAGDTVFIEYLKKEPKEKVSFETLARGDTEKGDIELGQPTLKQEATGEIVDNVKGDKVRVARFRAKTRYRKVRGFRHHLTKIKITKV